MENQDDIAAEGKNETNDNTTKSTSVVDTTDKNNQKEKDVKLSQIYNLEKPKDVLSGAADVSNHK